MNIVILTRAGISAESGINTFRAAVGGITVVEAQFLAWFGFNGPCY